MRFVSTLFACSLLSVGFAQVPEYVPSEGLVAWYPFNGNAQDESGNGHHATIDGATLADDRYGNFDAAFYFDGSDRIIAPQNVSPEGDAARTINAFFKSYTALPVGNNQYSLQAIFGSGSAAGGKVISTLNIDGNGTNPNHIPRTGHLYFSSGSWQDEAWSQESVSDSLWHMATMTYEGPDTPVRVYLDGQFQDETDPITLNTHLSDFYIGDVPWAVLFFNGLIDDMGVWNRALTDEEILALLGPAIPSGCTDTDACNFNDDAVVDDGSCIPSGCTDSYACNFDSESGCDDGSCDYSCCPGPGCCDVGMHWDWQLGMCRITNVADTNLDGCVQLNDLLDVLSAYGNCAADDSMWQCGDPLEYQGYDYETVQIGGQCWFAENLKSQQFSNGEFLDELSDNDDWVNATSSAYSVFDQELLYNGFTTMDDRGICPAGWSPGSNSDWSELADSLGGASIAGTALKDSISGGTNDSGFGGLMVGYRTYWNGEFLNQGSNAYFWTTTTNENGIQYDVRLSYSSPALTGGPNSTSEDGFSIRCIQDSE